MKRSSERIITTHAGRLQRPEDLTERMLTDPSDRPLDGDFEVRLKEAVRDVVKSQSKLGIDIVSDGEFGRLSWSSYVLRRLSGFEQQSSKSGFSATSGEDRRRFAEFYSEGGSAYDRQLGRTAEGTETVCAIDALLDAMKAEGLKKGSFRRTA